MPDFLVPDSWFPDFPVYCLPAFIAIPPPVQHLTRNILEYRPILLGEFGAYERAPMESRLAYTSFISQTAINFGWSFTYWQFDSDFIVYDIDKGEWNEPIYRALVPENE